MAQWPPDSRYPFARFAQCWVGTSLSSAEGLVASARSFLRLRGQEQQGQDCLTGSTKAGDGSWLQKLISLGLKIPGLGLLTLLPAQR